MASNTVAELVDRFVNSERASVNILDEPSILAQAIAAVNFYVGYSDLEAHLAIPIDDPPPDPPTPYPAVDSATEISVAEWSVIKPLFMLYVERESALQLEASRGLDVDVFGRSTSEIQSDINLAEDEIPLQAFYSDIVII